MHSLFVVAIVAVFALGTAAFFVALAGRLQPLAKALKIDALPRGSSSASSGAPREEAAWRILRIDAETSVALPSHESLERSRRARADLIAADPDFEPEVFLQRAETAYLLIKRALLLGDTAPLRAYVHPSLYALTAAEAERIAASPVRARAADIAVERVFVQSVESSTAGDRIWVHFDIKTRAQYVNVETGDVAGDMDTATRFGERCLFVRGAGLKTVVSGGVFAERCPACDCPLALSPEARCFLCKEEVSTGAHDWTLAAAVPVFYDEADADVLVDETLLDPAAGFAAIRAGDSAFSSDALSERVLQALEVLESVLKTGDLEGARSFMSQGLYLAWSMQAEYARIAGNTIGTEGTEVRNVAPASVRLGESFDEVTFRIEGMRARFVLDAQGELCSGSKQLGPFSELWTFRRSSCLSSSYGRAFERLCPACGVQAAVDTTGTCVDCGAAMALGASDWVLSRIVETGTKSSLIRAGAN